MLVLATFTYMYEGNLVKRGRSICPGTDLWEDVSNDVGLCEP